MSMRVGMIGLGIMGSAIGVNLIKNGFTVVGYDVDESKNQAMQEQGATIAASPAEVAAQSDVAFTSLPKVVALDDVVSGKGGLVESKKEGLVVCEFSTFPIEDKERARDALSEVGIILMDCPLSGTGAQAQKGDLSVYVSGEKSGYEKCGNVFDGFSRSNYYLGEFGNGSRMKFVANLLVAIHNVSAAEAFVLGMKSGLDPETIYKVIQDGAGTSRMFEVRGPMMVEGEYDEATMSIDMWQKDMKIIMEFAAALGSPAPLLSACAPIYHAALSQNRGNQDTASVCAVLEELANFKRK
ncbi:MAG: NAD(P)-dependent oxidoreductase [Rhodospirillales bacterium]|jgi:3-hydroxyisobutyrate dehydrogenase-like beta-hydroxyacid dehydrogenase